MALPATRAMQAKGVAKIEREVFMRGSYSLGLRWFGIRVGRVGDRSSCQLTIAATVPDHLRLLPHWAGGENGKGRTIDASAFETNVH